MNRHESYSITNPNNITDECAKFVIDDTGSPFVLSEVMQIGTQYTFSFWIKSEANYDVSVHGRTFTSTTTWQKYSATFTATSENLTVAFLNVGTYYIYHPKLEIGNMATDWSPAPEDTEKGISDAQSAAVAAQNTADDVQTNLKNNYYTKIQTDAQIKVSADGITSTVSSTYTTKKEFNDLEIGGRNLFAGYGEEEIKLNDYQNTGSFMQFNDRLTFNPCETVGQVYTISFWAKSPNGTTPLVIYNQNSQPRHFYFPRTTLTNALGNEWEYFSLTIENKDMGETYTDTYCNRLEIYAQNQMGVLVKKIKVECGDKATDWTPAPEDVSDATEKAQTTANDAVASIITVESTIKQLADSISALVRGEDGGTLVKQDANGLWYFDISDIEKNISDAANDLDDLDGIVRDANGKIDVLASTAAALQERTEYVRSYTDENGQPCLELGDNNLNNNTGEKGNFKVRITNTEIQFDEDGVVPAKINRKMLVIEKTMIKNELQFGDDEEVNGVWILKRRANGNLGLSWKGAD